MPIKRHSERVPGYDCIRNPCGRGNCGKTPGGSHGIHCDDWIYVVSDGDLALSLTVFSGIFPYSVPEDTVANLRSIYPMGADLSLHVGFVVPGNDWGDDDGQECPWVAGGRCYHGAYYSTALGARGFWNEHAGRDCGFVQPESFWMAMERAFREKSAELAPLRKVKS